jgi:hypothetical protein
VFLNSPRTFYAGICGEISKESVFQNFPTKLKTLHIALSGVLLHHVTLLHCKKILSRFFFKKNKDYSNWKLEKLSCYHGKTKKKLEINLGNAQIYLVKKQLNIF